LILKPLRGAESAALPRQCTPSWFTARLKPRPDTNRNLIAAKRRSSTLLQALIAALKRCATQRQHEFTKPAVLA
jgi:hypothetical protein